MVQNHYLRISWKKEVLRELNDIYAGDAFEAVRSEIVKIHDRVLRGRVFIALHMHAGDGNVHTNIPVNSDNVEMIKTANEGVAYVMEVAKKLGGAISGEHGIGLSKRPYFLRQTAKENLQAMNAIKTALDPQHILNNGKSYLTGGNNNAGTF